MTNNQFTLIFINEILRDHSIRGKMERREN